MPKMPEKKSMELEAVSIPKPAEADSQSRAQWLSQMNVLWDAQPSRRESISPEESKDLAEARRAFRAQNFLRMNQLLQGLSSAEALNLRGVLHEALGNHNEARRLYQLALAEDRSLFSAEMNLRRSFELWEFGESQIPFAL